MKMERPRMGTVRRMRSVGLRSNCASGRAQSRCRHNGPSPRERQQRRGGCSRALRAPCLALHLCERTTRTALMPYELIDSHNSTSRSLSRETLSHEPQEAFIYVYYRGRMNGVKEIRDLSDGPPKARSQGRCGGELSSPHGRCF